MMVMVMVLLGLLPLVWSVLVVLPLLFFDAAEAGAALKKNILIPWSFPGHGGRRSASPQPFLP